MHGEHNDSVDDADLDYDAILQRGGSNGGDEDFTLFKCSSCGHVYLVDSEIDTVFVDPADLSKRADAGPDFRCVACSRPMRVGAIWWGPQADADMRVTHQWLAKSAWNWVVRKT